MAEDQQLRDDGDHEERSGHPRDDQDEFVDFFENAAVPMHWVESEPDAGSTFSFTLPQPPNAPQYRQPR